MCSTWEAALLANIRLGWKVLSGTNTITYFEHLEDMTVKCFRTLAPRTGLLVTTL
jgi:hypothetical protein